MAAEFYLRGYTVPPDGLWSTRARKGLLMVFPYPCTPYQARVLLQPFVRPCI